MIWGGVTARLVVAFTTLPLLLLLTGCQVRLTAGLDARSDGTGSVRAGVGFDDEALRELGDPAKELRLDDLRQAGWDVTAPRKERDGLTWVRAAKPFDSPAQASRVAAELSGPDGPFREFRLVRIRSFLRTTTRFTGVVDLSKGLTGLSDPALQDRLGNADLALDPAGLQRRFGPTVDRNLQVTVEARLPGGVDSSNGARAAGRGVAWQPRVGEQLEMEARADSWNLQPLLPAVAALAFAVAALALVVVQRHRG